MKIFKNKKDLVREINKIKNLSFVPTMGGLHKGHAKLIKSAKRKAKKIIVSIYINPKQFNSKKDFKNYPRNLKKDLNFLKKEKVNFVFLPNYKDVYGFIPKKNIFLDIKSRLLCGKFRPGHFKGVVNVVNRLLEIIKPKYIILGKKDYQQFFLLKKHIKKNKIKTSIILHNTVRDKYGIALSSRNKLLTKKQLRKAAKVYKLLKSIKTRIDIKNFENTSYKIKNKLKEIGLKKIDYISILNLKDLSKPKSRNLNFNIFIAYYIGKVRLIDNL